MTIHRSSAVAAGALALAATAGLLYVFDPATTAAYPSCPFRALTGLLCPLCGGLRAAHALLHGRVVDAFWLNPLMVSGGAAWVLVRGVAPDLKLGPTHHWTAAGIAGVVIFTVARNLL
jgi:hypothetical protein